MSILAQVPVMSTLAFVVPWLTRKFGANVAPPFVVYVAHSWTSSLGIPSVSPAPPAPWSLRASYHDAAKFPVVWSTAMAGLIWLFVPVSSFSLRAELHEAPSSSEWRSMMSMLSLSFFSSRVQIA